MHNPANRRIRTRMSGGAGGEEPRGSPYPDSTTILLKATDNDFLQVEAAAGPDAERARGTRLSVDASRPEGRGLSGSAFRNKQPCISNDYLADAKMSYCTIEHEQVAYCRCGVAVTLKDSEAVGVLLFLPRTWSIYI